ncbi:MAG: bifunctional phosphoribosylaminoimidazolecarboxamide formyltransferase/IMP cyclohydrolase PurH [Bacteroidetes bacterium]|nr:bifunctional phosphoribosylaminoimidazolecarboxamide formyltransferase/IMP cyclohydrolase PurH [Bacteroidota bacterium]
MDVKIKSALISVFYKDGLEPIVRALQQNNVTIYSTGGTQKFIEDLGIPCTGIEHVTGYPSILGGRVKTLHPKVFGGILARRENQQDLSETAQYEIPLLDLVIVDLYPFTETVNSGGSEQEVIEKIDIGGVSLIRAGAKNFNHTCIISDKADYGWFLEKYNNGNGSLNLGERKELARRAFNTTANYDRQIADWFGGAKNYPLRYGENPHQKAEFRGNLEAIFTKLQGKELSYNNLLDVDSALCLLRDFDKNQGVTCVIVKHNNACGVATRPTAEMAWDDALACDPVSAFGGILAINATVDGATAKKIDSLFFEVLLAEDYTPEALQILQAKANRILLKTHQGAFKQQLVRTVLNGVLVQDRDNGLAGRADMKPATTLAPNDSQFADLEFALKIVKHTKSNTIVLAKNNQLLASGTGQTSRVDALNQAIEKAGRFGFDLDGAVMASDAFFPFPDCVEIADKAGIKAVVQPGGSIKDQASIDYCNANNMAMVMTGMRHFKH